MIPPELQLDSPSMVSCTSSESPDSAELVWLLRRAEQRLTEIFDQSCKEVGLRDVRDTLVLALASEAEEHTQIEIAKRTGLDKSTLGLILNRLEEGGWIERHLHPQNKKVRIPRTTELGLAKLDEANSRGREAVNASLSNNPEIEISDLRRQLWQISQRSA